jgi:putative transposase
MPADSVQEELGRIRKWLSTRHVGQAFQPAVSWPELKPLARDELPAIAVRKRRLPHWELEGSTYFLTFRVHHRLGQVLSDATLASIVEEIVWLGHGERYLLNAYVIMPDHVHLLLIPLPLWTLPRLVKGIKGFSARRINSRLGRKGPFWQDETFDHLVRNEQDFVEKFNYIHENPVTAELVERPEDYCFSSLVTIHSYGRLESLPHIMSSLSSRDPEP